MGIPVFHSSQLELSYDAQSCRDAKKKTETQLAQMAEIAHARPICFTLAAVFGCGTQSYAASPGGG